MGFLTGKKLLITGVLSNRSIAYGIAKACHAQGAELAFSYVGERFKDRITEFAADFNSTLVFDCDVGDDALCLRDGEAVAGHDADLLHVLELRRERVDLVDREAHQMITRQPRGSGSTPYCASKRWSRAVRET